MVGIQGKLKKKMFQQSVQYYLFYLQLTYNKTYASPEIENFRREIFIENRAKIAKFNQEYGQGRRSFVQQLNPYGDMLFHEFFRNLNGYNR